MFHSSKILNPIFLLTLLSVMFSMILSVVFFMYIKKPDLLVSVLKYGEKNKCFLYVAVYSWIIYEFIFNTKSTVFKSVSFVSGFLLTVHICLRLGIIMFSMQHLELNQVWVLLAIILVTVNGTFRIAVKIGSELCKANPLNSNIILILGIMDDMMHNSNASGGYKFQINPQNSMHNWNHTGAVATIIGVAITAGFGFYNIHDMRLNLELKRENLELKKQMLVLES